MRGRRLEVLLIALQELNDKDDDVFICTIMGHIEIDVL